MTQSTIANRKSQILDWLLAAAFWLALAWLYVQIIEELAR